MILPNIRASFGRRDALHLVELLTERDAELRELAQERLDADGIDTLLDDPRVLNILLTNPEVKAPPSLVFYVLVRQALLEGGIEDRATADYVAAMVLAFVRSGRAHRISENDSQEYRYLVDMVLKLADTTPHEAFLLRVHLGDFALWLSGLFPDFIEGRARRRGAPPMPYYERMGATGYAMASESPEAETLGLSRIFTDVARHFSGVRIALNRVSDRYLYPGRGHPVEQLLREVSARAI